MTIRKSIEVTLNYYSILHGYKIQNQETRDFLKVKQPQKRVIAANTILAFDKQYITTAQLNNHNCFLEYSNSF